jgi:hypothetical protein
VFVFVGARVLYENLGRVRKEEEGDRGRLEGGWYAGSMMEAMISSAGEKPGWRFG